MSKKYLKLVNLLLVLVMLTLSACSASTTDVDPTLVENEEVATDESSIEDAETDSEIATDSSLSYPIADTDQGFCYDNQTLVDCPAEGEAFFGQNAQYNGNEPSYTDNGDGTVKDNVTGLMWAQSPDMNGDGVIDVNDKLSYEEALAYAETYNLAGYDDWRLPTIKELYSLILFSGTDVSICEEGNCEAIPFIDTDYFDFAYGDTDAGERVIDSQYASSTKYVDVVDDYEMLFGVNFADGRIKGYGMQLHGQDKTYFVLYVRGNTEYGQNAFIDNGDGTITDEATGLMWSQEDSGVGMDWESALSYCENLTTAGYDDWRLPDVKELQSIVDYTRSPGTTGSAAIDPLFSTTEITNEVGETDYGFYWSGTTHMSSNGNAGWGSYVSFGRAMGYMDDVWMDVHGAGAQRSDPKTGDADEYNSGHGPQGDAVRIENFVRCVRGGDVTLDVDGNTDSQREGITLTTESVNTTSHEMPSDAEQSGEMMTPPQEALDACEGKNVNDACEFNTPSGLISGTCLNIENDVACVPGIMP